MYSNYNISILSSTDFIKRLPFGGASGFVENILKEIEHPVTIFGIGVNGATPFSYVELRSGVTFVPICDIAYPSRIPMRLKCFFWYLWQRKRILNSAVLLYAHSPEITLPFLFFNRNVPVIYHQHGSGNPMVRAKYRWARNKFLQKLFDEVQKVIHLRSDWNIVIDKLCLVQAGQNGADKKTTMIMNAVDTEKFKPDIEIRNQMRSRFCLSQEHCAILFVGRIEEIKRVDRVVEAISILKAKEALFKLFIAGDGTLINKLKDYVSIEKLEADITFLGNVHHDELPSYYNMADALVLPSEMEGVPMVILESLACGTPVIASNVGGVPDIIREEVNGFSLEDVTPVKLADVIYRVSKMSFERAAISETVNHLSTVQFAHELRNIIEKVMRNKQVANEN